MKKAAAKTRLANSGIINYLPSLWCVNCDYVRGINCTPQIVAKN
jgi:hypothetical protein